MPDGDGRSMWLVTHEGQVVGACWALARTVTEIRADVPAARRRHGWGAALSDEQAADPAWDAVPTEWRAAPGVPFERTGAYVEGGGLYVAGLRCHLGDPGDWRGPARPPNPEIVDQAELVAAWEAHTAKQAPEERRPLVLTERRTGRRVLVLHARPLNVTDEALRVVGEDVIVRDALGLGVVRIRG